jgi:hypothetical protein
MISEVTIFKLLSGEELICNVKKVEGALAVIEDVAIVQMIPLQSGKMTIGLIPFAPYSDDNLFTLNLEHVTIKYKPGVDLLNKYNQIYGSGIVVASSPLKQ